MVGYVYIGKQVDTRRAGCSDAKIFLSKVEVFEDHVVHVSFDFVLVILEGLTAEAFAKKAMI